MKKYRRLRKNKRLQKEAFQEQNKCICNSSGKQVKYLTHPTIPNTMIKVIID